MNQVYQQQLKEFVSTMIVNRVKRIHASPSLHLIATRIHVTPLAAIPVALNAIMKIATLLFVVINTVHLHLTFGHIIQVNHHRHRLHLQY